MMKIRTMGAGLVAGWLSAQLVGAAVTDANDYVLDNRASPHAQLRPLPFDAVQWTDGFWADRFKQLCNVTLDESWRLLADPEAGHVLDNFRAAAAAPGTGKYQGTSWQDEWLYKWIEAAACVWRVTRDPSVERRMNEGISLIVAAQQPDGYLATKYIVTGQPRFTEPREHEIYNMGHLLTAGVIHYRVTGQTDLFDVARRAADFLCANLGVTLEPCFAHNPSAIMGLVELYRVTGQKKYLTCAGLVVDRRGEKPKKQALFTMTPGIGGTDLIQDRVPVRESSEIVGHNVFFTYLYTGAADVYAETGDGKLDAALQRLWNDLTLRKMFIHGGVSAMPMGISSFAPVVEAAGPDYDLPNATCYNETCGQIGCFMWGYRMLSNHPDRQFADIMEREMYNGFLGAIGLDGRSWFYRNILRRYDANFQPTAHNEMAQRGQPGRKAICCPSNLLRTIAQLSAYFYSLDEQGLWVHHYGGNRVACTLATGEPFAFEQVTDYPWSGEVKFVIRAAPSRPVALRLRVPGWAGQAAIAVAGQPVPDLRMEHGYATVAQAWKAGDTVTLSVPMPSQLVSADPRVENARNQIAVMRGPVVYCVESPDLPAGVAVPEVYLRDDATFEPAAGVAGAAGRLAKKSLTLRGLGLHRTETLSAPLYRPLSREKFRPFDLQLIPYYAWGNRGPSAMSVWLPVVFQVPSATK